MFTGKIKAVIVEPPKAKSKPESDEENRMDIFPVVGK